MLRLLLLALLAPLSQGFLTSSFLPAVRQAGSPKSLALLFPSLLPPSSELTRLSATCSQATRLVSSQHVRPRTRIGSIALRAQHDDSSSLLRSLADVRKLSALVFAEEGGSGVRQAQEMMASGSDDEALELLLDSVIAQKMSDEQLAEMWKALETTRQPVSVDRILSHLKTAQMSPLLRIQGGVTMARVLGIGLGRSREALEVVRLLNEELELESKERDVELLRARLGSVKTRLQMREGDVKGAWATQSEVVRAMDQLAANSSELCVEVSLLAAAARQKGDVHEAKLLALRAKDLLPADEPLLSALVRGEYGSILLAVGEWDQAVREKLDVVDIVIQETGPESRAAAQAMDELGVCLQAQGKYKEAENYLRKALEIREGTRDGDASEVAASYLNLGSCMMDMGNTSLGRQLRQTSLEICKQYLPKDHYQTALALTSVGESHLADGELDEAQEQLEEAIDMWERLLGSNNPNLAAALTSLGRVLAAKQEPQRALLLFQRGLSIKRLVYGEAHPSIATSLNHLAGLWEETWRNRDEAYRLRREALEILQLTLGSSHPKVAVHMNNLAILEAKRGNYAEASELVQHALKIDQEIFGEESVQVATDLNSLATLAFHCGERQLSRQLYERAYEIRRKCLGEEHPRTLASLKNLLLVQKQIDADEV